MRIRDRLGWPIETPVGASVLTRVLRYLIHGSAAQTWKLRRL